MSAQAAIASAIASGLPGPRKRGPPGGNHDNPDRPDKKAARVGDGDESSDDDDDSDSSTIHVSHNNDRAVWFDVHVVPNEDCPTIYVDGRFSGGTEPTAPMGGPTRLAHTVKWRGRRCIVAIRSPIYADLNIEVSFSYTTTRGVEKVTVTGNVGTPANPLHAEYRTLELTDWRRHQLLHQALNLACPDQLEFTTGSEGFHVTVDGEPTNSPPPTIADLRHAFRSGCVTKLPTICVGIVASNSRAMLGKALTSILHRALTLPAKERQAYYKAAAPLGKAFVRCVRNRPGLFTWVPGRGFTPNRMYHAIHALVVQTSWTAFLADDINRLRIFTRHMTRDERLEFKGLTSVLGCERVIDGTGGTMDPAVLRAALHLGGRLPIPARVLVGFLMEAPKGKVLLV